MALLNPSISFFTNADLLVKFGSKKQNARMELMKTRREPVNSTQTPNSSAHERKSFKSWHWLFNTCDGWTLVLNSIQCHSAYHKNWTIICSIQRHLSRMLSWDTSTGAMIFLLFEPLTSLLDLELSAASWDMPTCTCVFLTDGCQINTRDDNYSPSKPWGLLKHCTDQCPRCECDESNSEAAQGINWTSQTPKKLCTVLP